jgi:perosamine synthetase
MVKNQNIPLFKVYMPPESVLIPRIREVLYSGQISEGEPVYEFERRFAAFVGHSSILSFNSGTAALHAALILGGVVPGDEVISTAMTAEPTNMAILHSGAKIVWADVDPFNGNLTPESIAANITTRTKAIMVVHYGGIPAPMQAIYALAKSRGIVVVEDAAHALGAKYNGNAIGVGGDFTMFSLQAIKHMTTIDGGMLACKDAKGMERGRRLRWFGIDRALARTEVDVKEVGYKYNMNNFNATVGLAQLDYIQPIIERHIENGRYYEAALRGTPGLELCRWESCAKPSHWFFTILSERRDELSRKLSERGIGNSQCHKRNDRHSVFGSSRRNLPGLDRFYDRMLHIPCGWWVRDEEREYITATIKEGW